MKHLTKFLFASALLTPCALFATETSYTTYHWLLTKIEPEKRENPSKRQRIPSLPIECTIRQEVTLSEGFVVEGNANVILQCDGAIDTAGIMVKDSGELTLSGSTVTLGPDTTIEKGVTFNIQ